MYSPTLIVGFCVSPTDMVCIDCIEEFRTSHGGAPSAGVGTSYLCCSNCDGIERDTVTTARADQ